MRCLFVGRVQRRLLLGDHFRAAMQRIQMLAVDVGAR